MAFNGLSVLVTPPGASAPVEVTQFRSWSVTSCLTTPADHWSLSITPTAENRKLFAHSRKGAVVEIYLDGTEILIGRIDTVSRAAAGSAYDLQVSGRDMAGLLLDSCVPKDSLSVANLTLEQIIRKFTVDIWGDKFPDVYLDNGPNRYQLTSGTYKSNKLKSVGEVKSKPFGRSSPFRSGVKTERIRNNRIEYGETIWPVLAELAQQANAHLWCAADGSIVAAAPCYTMQPDAYGSWLHSGWDPEAERAVGGNISELRYDTSLAGRCSTYEVAGVGKSSPKSRGKALLLAGGVVHDPSPCFWDWPNRASLDYVPGVIKATTQDKRKLTRYARRIVTERILNGFSLTIRVPGLRTNGVLWATDTMVNLNITNIADEIHSLIGPYYIYRVERRLSSTEGATTSLHLWPPDIWLSDMDEPEIGDDAWYAHLQPLVTW
jgi:prophage tail gpP-like protein